MIAAKKKAAQLDAFKEQRQAKIKAQFARRARLAKEKPPAQRPMVAPAGPKSPPRANPKQKRIKCPQYLAFVRLQPCACCRRPSFYEDKNQPHHLYTVGSGGSDFAAVPLCAICHAIWHNTGRHTFKKRTGIDLEAVNKALVARWKTKNGHQ